MNPLEMAITVGYKPCQEEKDLLTKMVWDPDYDIIAVGEKAIKNDEFFRYLAPISWMPTALGADYTIHTGHCIHRRKIPPNGEVTIPARLCEVEE